RRSGARRSRACRHAVRSHAASPAPPVREAEAAGRLLQPPAADAGRFAGGPRPEAGGPAGVGRDADGPDRHRGRDRFHLHLSGQWPWPARQLDRAVSRRRAGAAARHQRIGDDDLQRADPGPCADGGAGGRDERAPGGRRRAADRRRRNLRPDRHPRRGSRLYAGGGKRRPVGHGACHAGAARGDGGPGAGAEAATGGDDARHGNGHVGARRD
ncbi:hypothetical protein LTR94_030546, partial [Friedmanniomyces endolithicus]